MTKHKRYFYKKNHLQQLRGFCVATEEGSTLKAAAKLNTVHSNIRFQIKALEDETKLTLVKKEGKKLEPTEEGLKLYKLAKKILTDVDNLFEDTVNQLKYGNDNLIKIAGHAYAFSHLLQPYFKKIVDENPDVKFELHNVTRDEAFALLKDKIVDFVVFPVYEKLDSGIISESFHVYDISFVCHKNHPLAKIDEKDITWAQIAKYDFMTVGKNMLIEDINRFIKPYKNENKFIIHNGNWEIVAGLVLQNLTSSICDYQYISSKNNPDLIIKRCSHLAPEYKFSVAVNLDNTISPSAAKMLYLICPKILLRLNQSFDFS